MESPAERKNKNQCPAQKIKLCILFFMLFVLKITFLNDIPRVCHLQKQKSQTIRINILQKFDFLEIWCKTGNKSTWYIFDNYVPVICTDLIAKFSKSKAFYRLFQIQKRGKNRFIYLFQTLGRIEQMVLCIHVPVKVNISFLKNQEFFIAIIAFLKKIFQLALLF